MHPYLQPSRLLKLSYVTGLKYQSVIFGDLGVHPYVFGCFKHIERFSLVRFYFDFVVLY